MVINIIKVIFEESAKYAILALGVYISYSILDFPDMSVDGTMPLGAILSAVLIVKGVNPWLSLLIAFAAGCVAGAVTGILHVKLKIRPLLCGILVFTALLSINLVIAKAGTGTAIVSVFGKSTIFDIFPSSLLPAGLNAFKKLIVLAVIVILIKLALDWYLKTKSGMLLRATGANEKYVVMLGKNPGVSKIIGLAIGNGLAAFAGGVIAQANQTANATMGTGMVVFGLSSVIIGITICRKLTFIKATTAVIIGSIIYRGCLQLAIFYGLPSDYNKILMAVMFVIALLISGWFQKRGAREC